MSSKTSDYQNLEDDGVTPQLIQSSMSSSILSISDSQIYALEEIKKNNSDFTSIYAIQRISHKIADQENYSNTEFAQQIKAKYKKLSWFRSILIIVYILLLAFQRPTWCNYNDYQDHCSKKGDIYIVTVMPFYFPDVVYYVLEMIVLILLLINKLAKLLSFNVKTHQKILFSIIVLLTIITITNDIIVIYLENDYNYNISTLFKPIFLIFYSRKLQLSFLQQFEVINTSKEILYLLVFTLLLYAAIGKVVFHNYECNPIFNQDILGILKELFILQTTVNSPDVYLDYYAENRLSSLYFISFQFINTTLIINMIVAIFYTQYKSNMQANAQDIMYNHSAKFDKLINKYIMKRTSSNLGFNVNIQSESEELIQNIIENTFYEILMEGLSLSIFIFIFVEESFTISILNFVFNMILLMECVIITYLVGFKQIYKRQSFIINFILSICLVGLTLLDIFIVNEIIRLIMQLLMCQRIFRLTKIFLQSKQFMFLAIQLIQIIPYFGEIFGILFIWFIFYSALGQLLFGGLVRSDSVELLEERGLPSNYINITFNDNLSGLTTCWDLLLINNWNLISRIFEAVTGNPFTIIFFIIYYITVVLVTLNVTIALIIDYIINRWNRVKDQMNSSILY